MDFEEVNRYLTEKIADRHPPDFGEAMNCWVGGCGTWG